MTSPDIPGAPLGYNCRLSARGYGSRVLRCVRISYRVQIGTTDDEGPNARAVYPLHRLVPGFTVVAAMLSYAEREAFNRWMREYMQRVASNQRVSGYVHVSVPARGFSRAGVPVGPLAYGDQAGQFYYPTTIGFVGATDPISAVGGGSPAGSSRYIAPSKDRTEAPYFYPAGNQKAGAESLEGTFYDPRPAAPSPNEVSEVPPYEQSGRFGPVPR
jgi:hypothetical protein